METYDYYALVPTNISIGVVLDKLFEFTGDGDDGGFILAYVTQDGRPLIQCKIGSQIVEMGLRKALERFLEDMELGEKALSEENPS